MPLVDVPDFWEVLEDFSFLVDALNCPKGGGRVVLCDVVVDLE
jgi:hypothetical protein